MELVPIFPPHCWDEWNWVPLFSANRWDEWNWFQFSQHIAGVNGTGFHIFPANCLDGWVPLFPIYSHTLAHTHQIPKEIGELRALGCLDISHNDIRHLPDEIGNLNHLFLLNLQGLNKLSLDPSLMKGPTKSIISFLKSRRVKVWNTYYVHVGIQVHCTCIYLYNQVDGTYVYNVHVYIQDGNT